MSTSTQRAPRTQPNVLIVNEPFTLESGTTLPSLEIAYHTHGRLSPERDNVVWIYHALTANSDPVEWWPGVVGPGKAIDTDRWFVVCANVLGSPYGTSGPLSINPLTGRPWYGRFPQVTIKDIVRAFSPLRDYLRIDRIRLGVGSSLGGQQAIEAAAEEPGLFEQLALIATNARHSPWGIAWNATQRMAIESDPTHTDDSPDAGAAGLAAARAIALLSYRTHALYGQTQKEVNHRGLDAFRAESYQRYQGEKLVRRFNAHSYLLLSKAMDSHNVGRGRGSVEEGLRRVTARTLVAGITSDLLFPTEEQRFLAEHIPDAVYHEIDSPYGHDGFLIEGEQVGRLLARHLEDPVAEQVA